jgi:hypothetical protein
MTVNQLECYLDRAIEILVSAFFTMAQEPPVCQGLLINEASPSYSYTPQLVGLLWTSDHPVAETSN